MKTFRQFQEDLSRNVIPLDKKTQDNLNKSRGGQIGPGSKGVPNRNFRIEPIMTLK